MLGRKMIKKSSLEWFINRKVRSNNNLNLSIFKVITKKFRFLKQIWEAHWF